MIVDPMLRSTNLIVLAMSTACVAAGSPACAGDHPARPRILLAQFGTEPAPDPQPARDAGLEPQLEEQFAVLGGDRTANSNSTGRDPASFLRTPTVRIPAWMRGARRADIPGVSGNVPAMAGDCAPRPYVPSSLLGRSAEERRRILYPVVRSVACEAGLPIGLMDAMLIQESRYNPLATSPKGAFGLGQLMPGTADQLGVDRYDLRGNLTGAARYLRQHIDEFRQVPLALAAYNAGPARVRKSWSIPRLTETQNYVRQILTNWRTLEFKATPASTLLTPPATRQSSLVVSRFR
ncbi:lytic transglycosylase domain-containing protein [Novosphingobium sp. G106]|uniref:lytic transglycosylase domain-containing protein n=1 Tax=Novosphingobium sp. G106 TaxID=2849500 RepID=UPI001C2DE8B0|nr:lytic transglycosylase domain-containing protein [Novosphingobium sp. G106]MBV1692259.1 lytic transglycosylase domain-containing protein [Novosphingobium sp. G106]